MLGSLELKGKSPRQAVRSAAGRARVIECWPTAIGSTSLPEPRDRTGGQDGHATGNPSARSDSTRTDPKPGAEAMGSPTRSPVKLAAATPWPAKPNKQRENESRRQFP